MDTIASQLLRHLNYTVPIKNKTKIQQLQISKQRRHSRTQQIELYVAARNCIPFTDAYFHQFI